MVDSIVARIKAGELPPGSRLPSVKDLTAEHGDSTARRVMRTLQDQGWAVSVGPAGTFVADPLPSTLPTIEERLAALEAWRAEVERGNGQRED